MGPGGGRPQPCNATATCRRPHATARIGGERGLSPQPTGQAEPVAARVSSSAACGARSVAPDDRTEALEGRRRLQPRQGESVNGNRQENH